MVLRIGRDSPQTACLSQSPERPKRFEKIGGKQVQHVSRIAARLRPLGRKHELPAAGGCAERFSLREALVRGFLSEDERKNRFAGIPSGTLTRRRIRDIPG